VKTGRETAIAALKPLLIEAGWRPRAAGWFTKEMRPRVTAVIAVYTSVEHFAAGSAGVTFQVGLRVEDVEEIVEQVTGPWKPRYAGRTWVKPLGYLLENPGYNEGSRTFDPAKAGARAEELVRMLRDQAEPRLREMDDSETVALAKRSPSEMGASGLCRIALLVTRALGPDAGRDYVLERVSSLGVRTEGNAVQEREIAPKVLSILGSL
jgi:hypothetical protein